MATTKILHPTVGPINGSTAKEGVVQFLGLQYATLADRFAPPAMREYGEQNETIEATKLGPQVLSVAPNADGEFALLQHTLEYDRSTLTQSDTEGLCLNITVPEATKGGPDTSTKLPVFVFIHGGGFVVGSNVYPHYRLGGPGFMTSSQMRKAGKKPNNGLRDQRTALLWLQKHISGFGGDPDNITLMGESAGGISACYHLFSKEPLFKRMMPMSGTMLLVPAVTPEVADANYADAMKALGLGGDHGDVENMVKMDAQEFVVRLARAGTPALPVLDDEICPTNFDFASIMNDKTSIPGQQWCEAVIIGDCAFDGNIQGLRFGHRKKGCADAFCKSITNTLGSSNSGTAEKLLSGYGLKPDLGDDEGFFKILQVANDLNFYIPTLALAQNLSKHMETYMYRFNQPNPWEGPWKGHATHILDLTFLLQNFNEYLDESQRGSAEQFAKDVIRFVNGQDPWTAWKRSGESQGEAKVLGPNEKMEVVEDVPEKVERRSIILDLAREVGLDKLNDALNAFLNTTPPV
ncbi:hypothetical protein LTR37_019437 [Vermiconidia calcicola]|uniref:Uncharacterized protein n=1 Tax=Vermiconidia calcicola TaxID=1690605 RepID=A0ACC3MH54_9PEZI|nr:hypothetical protein LTR37_019437 [Vermiconidia calcicola]